MNNLQRLVWIVLLSWLFLGSYSVMARTQLIQSTPSNGGVICSDNSVIQMQFDKKTKLISVEIADLNDHKISLELPVTSAMWRKYSVQVPPLASGQYILRWKARSRDYIYVTGSLGFEYRKTD